MIDDNPLSLMQGGGNEVFIPTLHAGYVSSDYNVDSVKDNFELGWLQSPRDVVEFRTLSDMLIRQNGSQVLIEKGFVPEIILFDYRLSEGLNKYIDIDEDEYKKVIPTYKMSLELGKKPHRFFDWDNENEYSEKKQELKSQYPNFTAEQISSLAKVQVKKQIQDKNKANEPSSFSNPKDDMGCYAGGIIALHFKDHPCVGTPITSKEGETDISNDALYFEWLLEKDFDNQFGKKYGRKPYWDVVIPHAVKLLQDRINSLVIKNKITLNLTQLLNYAGKDIPTEQNKRVFTFQSVYGMRHLPLDGLFIDVEEANRNESIKNFAKVCLDLHLKNANDGLTKDVLEAAIKFCAALLEQYDNKEGKFLERIRFSQLKQKADNSTITTKQQTELDGFYTKLGMNKDAKEYNDAFDLRHYNGPNDNLVKRYAALFVMVNIYNRYLEFKESNADKAEFKGKPYLFTQPEKMDYLLAIYPRPATPLVMPLHGESDGLDNDLKRTTKRTSTDTAGILINSVLNKKDGISDGEKFLLQSYANGIGMKKENFAEWFT